ncbi:unnamed protein product [Bathycoccus prasinos]
MFLGPWFSWVDDINNDDIDGKSKEEDLVKALRYVVKFVRKHGPYASAVGFSQGGAIRLRNRRRRRQLRDAERLGLRAREKPCSRRKCGWRWRS